MVKPLRHMNKQKSVLLVFTLSDKYKMMEFQPKRYAFKILSLLSRIIISEKLLFIVYLCDNIVLNKNRETHIFVNSY